MTIAQRNIHGIIKSQIQVADFEFSKSPDSGYRQNLFIRSPFRPQLYVTGYMSKLESQTNESRKFVVEPQASQAPKGNNY